MIAASRLCTCGARARRRTTVHRLCMSGATGASRARRSLTRDVTRLLRRRVPSLAILRMAILPNSRGIVLIRSTARKPTAHGNTSSLIAVSSTRCEQCAHEPFSAPQRVARADSAERLHEDNRCRTARHHVLPDEHAERERRIGEHQHDLHHVRLREPKPQREREAARIT